MNLTKSGATVLAPASAWTNARVDVMGMHFTVTSKQGEVVVDRDDVVNLQPTSRNRWMIEFAGGERWTIKAVCGSCGG